MSGLLYIFIGGGLGSMARYAIGDYLKVHSYHFAWGTLLANAIACLLLGLILGYEVKSGIKADHKLLLATGFCGGFSTFSTFSAEFLQHLIDGAISTAFLYVATSLAIGLLAVYVGFKII